jgi:hypothetical protein
VRKYRRRRLGKNCARDITFHFARERFLLCKLVNILTSVVVFQRFNGRAVPFFCESALFRKRASALELLSTGTDPARRTRCERFTFFPTRSLCFSTLT